MNPEQIALDAVETISVVLSKAHSTDPRTTLHVMAEVIRSERNIQRAIDDFYRTCDLARHLKTKQTD